VPPYGCVEPSVPSGQSVDSLSAHKAHNMQQWQVVRRRIWGIGLGKIMLQGTMPYLSRGRKSLETRPMGVVSTAWQLTIECPIATTLCVAGDIKDVAIPLPIAPVNAKLAFYQNLLSEANL
jgi:hypothetical protein